MIEEKNFQHEENIQTLTLDKKTMDDLLANIIPISKHLEVQFDHIQDQINKMKDDINKSHEDIKNRFEEINRKVDNTNINMERRFDKTIEHTNRLTDKLEDRDDKQRDFTLRLFTITITIAIIALLTICFK